MLSLYWIPYKDNRWRALSCLSSYLIYKKTPSRPIFVSCPQASDKQNTSPHLTEGRHVNNLCLLLLLLLSRFSRVQLCATPETAAHQAPPSLGFSRQEHWSGLPFPSPGCESEVPQPCLCDPMDCSLPGCATHGIFLTRVLEWGAIASLNLCLGHIKNNLKPENGEIIIK